MLGQILESLSFGTGIKYVGVRMKKGFLILDIFIQKFVSLNCFPALPSGGEWRETLFVKQLSSPNYSELFFVVNFK